MTALLPVSQFAEAPVIVPPASQAMLPRVWSPIWPVAHDAAMLASAILTLVACSVSGSKQVSAQSIDSAFPSVSQTLSAVRLMVESIPL